MTQGRQRGAPLLAVFLTCIVGGGGLIIAAIAILPGPGPDPLITQVVVMHNSMIPARPHLESNLATRPSEAPQLESRVDGVLDGRTVASWLYRIGVHSVSVHRLPGHPRLPENASSIPLGDATAQAFEITDLAFVCWKMDKNHTLAVVGAAPLGQLLRFAERVVERGPGPDTLPLPPINRDRNQAERVQPGAATDIKEPNPPSPGPTEASRQRSDAPTTEQEAR